MWGWNWLRAFRVSGEISLLGELEATHVQRISRDLTAKTTLITDNRLSEILVVSSLQYAHPTWTARAAYSSAKQIVLCNALKRVYGRLDVGAEILYSIAEGKPGMSIGCRYSWPAHSTTSISQATSPANNKRTQLVLSFGVMGHLRASYTREVLPNVVIAARYQLNTNDLKSQVGVGVDCLPTTSFPFVLRAKYDTRDGVGVCVGAAFGRARVLIGTS